MIAAISSLTPATLLKAIYRMARRPTRVTRISGDTSALTSIKKMTVGPSRVGPRLITTCGRPRPNSA